MQRKSLNEYRELFLQALNTANWNDVVLWATEMLNFSEDEAYVWATRGIGLSKLGHPIDAILNYDRALALNPSDPAILLSNKGAAYWDLMNEPKALEALHKAIKLSPMAETYMTLGNIYKFQGKLDEATDAYYRSIEVNPNYVDGHLVLGMTLLKQGNFEQGWKEYEWRWKSDQLPPRRLKCPQWAGEDLTGKTILVYGEQGLGDIIQFARYARTLSELFPKCKVIIEGRPPLKRLLETMKSVYAVINAGEKVPPIDYAVPMITLAGLLTPNISSIPSLFKQYHLHHADVESWGEKLKALPEGFRIGVCWSGMSRTAHPAAAAVDAVRSTTFESFAPLAKVPGVVWVSLQKGPPAEQVKNPPRNMIVGDFTEDMYDFYETCCAIENCDLVITVDTAVAHAAASIGKPTWVVSRWDGCWRWFGDRPDSPWYPTVSQFVQPAPHDWDGVMKKMAVELAKVVSDKSEPELNLTLAK